MNSATDESIYLDSGNMIKCACSSCGMSKKHNVCFEQQEASVLILHLSSSIMHVNGYKWKSMRLTVL